MDNPKIGVIEMELQPDQSFILYSDGLIEGVNASGTQNSGRRMERYLKKLPGEIDGPNLFGELLKFYNGFMAGTRNKDDVTLVVVEPKPTCFFT